MKQAEEQRLEVEREKREKERRLQEMKEIQKQQVWDRVESLRGTDVGKRAFKNLSTKEIDEMDPDDILQRQYEQLEREKREQTSKLRAQEKRIDHLVRAQRIDEIPLLEQHIAAKKIQDQKDWEREEAERVTNAQADHASALQTKNRYIIDKSSLPTHFLFISSIFDPRASNFRKSFVATWLATVELQIVNC